MCIQVVWLGKEHCKATWEPEASIPPCIIRDYELGLQPEVLLQSVSYGGQTNHTLLVHNEDVQPKAKKRKVEQKRCVSNLHNVIQCHHSFKLYGQYTLLFYSTTVPDTGVYEEDEPTLTCNTEKDKQRLNERTAGMQMMFSHKYYIEG